MSTPKPVSPDFAAMARDFLQYFPMLDTTDIPDLAEKFKAVATLSHAAGRAEGLTEAERVAIAFEQRVRCCTGISARIRALASDPVAGDQAAEDQPIFLPGGYGDRLVNAAEAYLADFAYSPDPDGPYADHELTTFERAMIEDFLAGLFAEREFSGVLQEMARAAVKASPATVPGLAAQEVERLRAIETAAGQFYEDWKLMKFGGRSWTDLCASLSAPRPAQAKEGPTE